MRVDFACVWSFYGGLFDINQDLLNVIRHDCNPTNNQIDNLVSIFTHEQLQNHFMWWLENKFYKEFRVIVSRYDTLSCTKHIISESGNGFPFNLKPCERTYRK